MNLWQKIVVKCNIFICYSSQSTKTSLVIMNIELLYICHCVKYYTSNRQWKKIILGIKTKQNLVDYEIILCNDRKLEFFNIPTPQLLCHADRSPGSAVHWNQPGSSQGLSWWNHRTSESFYQHPDWLSSNCLLSTDCYKY